MMPLISASNPPPTEDPVCDDLVPCVGSAKYELTDFAFWVMYGSWSSCAACGSHFYNDKYFRTKMRDELCDPNTRRAVPDDPILHSSGKVGVSSRWWYLPGMYNITVEQCPCCNGKEAAGPKLARRMAEATSGPKIAATGELYRIPFAGTAGDEAKVCVRWPQYIQGEFQWSGDGGSSMLELTKEECAALARITSPCEEPLRRAPVKSPCEEPL